MAIYHLEAKVISRGAGRSAVAAAAYMSCSRIYNDYDGILHDYTRKQGLVWEQVFLSEQAPQEWADRSVLWNAVEESEKTKDSRLAREFVAALPVELDKEQWKQLLTDFIQHNFVSEGMCADVSIHDTDSHNPHAHIMLTVRPLNEQGNWQYKTEKEYLCVKDGIEQGFTAAEFKAAQTLGWEKQYPYKVGKKKVYMPPSRAEAKGYKRASKYPKSTKYGRQNPITERWNSEEQLMLWREAWADVSNYYLNLSGYSERINHHSHATRGLDEQPTIHEGVWAGIMEQKGMVSERRELNRQIRADNKLLRELKAAVTILSETGMETAPEIAAKLETLRDDLIISHYHSSFNKMQLSGIREFLKKNKPLLSELKEVQKVIKVKLMERKALSTEKDKCPAWEVGKRIQMNRQYAALTEDIEELKRRRVQIFAALGCKEEAEVKVMEKKTNGLEDLRMKLEDQQKILEEQWQDATSKYTETLNAVAPEDLWEIEKERRDIRYGGRTELIQKLHEKYGSRFNRRQYDMSEKAVDEILPARKTSREKRSIAEQLQKESRHKEWSSLPQRKSDRER